MRVKDAMSKGVVTVTPETTFREIGEIIFGKRSNRKFSSVPVVDKNNKLLGIVTEKDLLRRLYPSQKELMEDFFGATNFYKMEEKIHEVEKLTAEEMMCEKPVVTFPEIPLMKACSLLLTREVRRLPVVDKEGKLVGVISQGDIFRAIFSRLKKPHPHKS